jgi:hypothetical protein
VNIGAVPMVMSPEANMVVPEGLFHAGHHFDGIGSKHCRNRQHSSVQFPCNKMHEYVAAKGLQRDCRVQNLFLVDIENAQELIVGNIK